MTYVQSENRRQLHTLCCNPITVSDGWMRIGPTRLRVDCLMAYADASEAILMHGVDGKLYTWTPNVTREVTAEQPGPIGQMEGREMRETAVEAQLLELDRLLHNWNAKG
jgi:hypothetical protein